MTNLEQQAELLERYWAALDQDEAATPPADLAPVRADFVWRLHRELKAAQPAAAFRARLRQQLASQADTLYLASASAPAMHPLRSTGPILAAPLTAWSALSRAVAALALIVLLAGSLLLANNLIGRAPSPAVVQTPTGGGTPQVVITSTVTLTTTSTPTPTPMPSLPSPNGSPYEPTTPTWDPRLPTPVGTFDMNFYLTPIVVTPAPPQPSATPAPPTPAPAAEILSSIPIRHQSGLTPITWGSEAAHSLTIWLGYFSDTGTPQLTDAHPIARWNGDFILEQSKASPDGNSLAVKLFQNYGQEGGNPVWLYVIDLQNNQVQPVPDPMKPGSNYSPSDMMFGAGLIDWIDNDRILVAGDDPNSPSIPVALAVDTKDGSSKNYCPAHPGSFQQGFIAMSPDRKTVFAMVQGSSRDNATDGYWLIDVNDCSKAHRIVSSVSSTRLINMGFMAPYDPSWSPDGKRIVFSGPSGPGGESNLQSWLWILSDPNGPNTNPTPISPIDKFDFSPLWSPDGKTIVLLRADSGPNGPLDSTNFFKYDLSSGQFSQLTHLSSAKSGDLQWSADGKYLLASTSVNGSSIASLVAIDSASGKLTTLLPGSSAAHIVAPLLFK